MRLRFIFCIALSVFGVVGMSAGTVSASAPAMTFTSGPTGIVDSHSASFMFTINRKPNAIGQLSRP